MNETGIPSLTLPRGKGTWVFLITCHPEKIRLQEGVCSGSPATIVPHTLPREKQKKRTY